MDNVRNGSYRTKQGSLVLSCFEANPDVHLTVEDIFTYLKENSTPVGITTIYRQAEKLVEEGIVRKYSLDEGSGACFQYVGTDNCREHFHLKCTRCGKLFHATCPYLDGINHHIFEHHGFTVDNTRTVFYGVCEDCLRQSKRK